MASFANFVSPIDANAEQPLFQSSPVVNVPPVNLPEVSAIQPPDVFTAQFDLSGFGNVISNLIDNLDNKDISIKLFAPKIKLPVHRYLFSIHRIKL